MGDHKNVPQAMSPWIRTVRQHAARMIEARLMRSYVEQNYQRIAAASFAAATRGMELP